MAVSYGGAPLAVVLCPSVWPAVWSAVWPAVWNGPMASFELEGERPTVHPEAAPTALGES